jgi:hypothetical protein
MESRPAVSDSELDAAHATDIDDPELRAHRAHLAASKATWTAMTVDEILARYA